MSYDANRVKEGRDKTRLIWNKPYPWGDDWTGRKWRRIIEKFNNVTYKTEGGRPGWAADLLKELFDELKPVYDELRKIQKEYEIY